MIVHPIEEKKSEEKKSEEKKSEEKKSEERKSEKAAIELCPLNLEEKKEQPELKLIEQD